ncbi:hypothetical protein [Litoreibacter ponti]|nr:hypothetical protein [Litoreibacter ponti]
MAEVMEMMAMIAALSAAFAIGSISRVRADEYFEVAGSVAHRPMSVNS